MKISNYRPDIDGLRALAVLCVIFYHVGFESFSGGYVGVDVFFVISGYLITNLIVNEVRETKSFNFANFYVRRARRLFPALFITCLLSFVCAFLLFTPLHFERFGGALASAMMSISNFFFWNESGYFNASSDFKPLLHTWSLSVEEQFYFLWPATLVFLLIRASKWIVPIVLVVGILFSLYLNLVFLDGEVTFISAFSPTIALWFADGASTIFYLTPFRFFEFGFGALLVWANRYRVENKIMLELLFLAGLVFILSSVFTYTENTVFPSLNAIMPCFGAALIIYSGTTRGYLGKLLSNRLAVGVGLISYSLYLVHWPIIVFYEYYIDTDIGLTERYGVVLASIFLSVLMFFFVEKPFRINRTNKNYLPPVVFGSVCGALVLTTTVLAATVWQNGGWDWRVNPDGLAFVENPKDYHRNQYGGNGYRPNKIITIGAKNTQPSFVIFGDSFANAFATGLYEIVEPLGKSGLALFDHGCFIGPDVTNFNKGIEDKLCSGEYQKILKVVEGNNLPVFISYSWDSYNGSLGIPYGEKIIFKDINVYREFVLGKMESIINQIGEKRKIVFIGTPPGNNNKSGLLNCIQRPSYIEIKCSSRMVSDEGQGYQFNPLLQNLSQKNANVFFWNPYDVFCNDGLCEGIISDKLMYSDGGHLSKDGSRYYMKEIQYEFLNILN